MTATIQDIETFLSDLQDKIRPLSPDIAASQALADIHGQIDPLIIELQDIVSDANANMAEAREAGELLKSAMEKGAECFAKGQEFTNRASEVLSRLSSIQRAVSDNADAIGEAVSASPIDDSNSAADTSE